MRMTRFTCLNAIAAVQDHAQAPVQGNALLLALINAKTAVQLFLALRIAPAPNAQIIAVPVPVQETVSALVVIAGVQAGVQAAVMLIVVLTAQALVQQVAVEVVQVVVQAVRIAALDAGLALLAAVPALVTIPDGLGHVEVVR